jgi:hypothetical protein
MRATRDRFCTFVVSYAPRNTNLDSKKKKKKTFFPAHIPATATRGVLRLFLRVLFSFSLQGTESSFMVAERKRMGHKGSTTKKEKGKERTGANKLETAFENGRKPDK